MALIASWFIHRRATKTHQLSQPWSWGSLIGSLLILAGCTFGLYEFLRHPSNAFVEEPPALGVVLLYSAVILPLIAPWLFYVGYRITHPSKP